MKTYCLVFYNSMKSKKHLFKHLIKALLNYTTLFEFLSHYKIYSLNDVTEVDGGDPPQQRLTLAAPLEPCDVCVCVCKGSACKTAYRYDSIVAFSYHLLKYIGIPLNTNVCNKLFLCYLQMHQKEQNWSVHLPCQKQCSLIAWLSSKGLFYLSNACV